MARRKKRVASWAVIENCDDRFRFRCPQKWEALSETDDRKIRHCAVCARNVHFCETLEELEQCAREGKCAAADRGPEVLVGEMKVLY